MKNIGIVLSGGGAKGSFEIGVLEVLLKKIKNDGDKLVGVAGTSIGAFNGAFVASGQFDLIKDIWLSWNNAKCPLIQYDFFNPYMSLVLKGYMYKSDPLKDFLQKNLDLESLHLSEIKYINTLVRLGDGEMILGGNIHPEKSHMKNLIPEIMASMSLVPGTPSVEIEGIAYGDGGFRDTVPVKSLIENVPKLDVIYVVNVNTEKRKWNSNILANNNASLAERLKFMYDDILWDENNRSDIEIGKLKFWNSDKYIIIYPEVMNVTTTDFSPTSIKEAYLHGMSMGRKYTK